MIPASMAEKRGRSQAGWFIFSLFFSPLLAIVIISLLGETEEKRKERLWEEAELRALAERRLMSQSDKKREFYGKTINDLYKR